MITLRFCRTLIAIVLIFAGSARAAIGEPSLLGTGAAVDFALVRDGSPAPLVVSPDDWPGVRRAAGDLQADIGRVTGRKPALGSAVSGATVIIGTLGRSEVIDGLVAAGKLDAAAIRGKWEACLIETVENPLPGVDRALVIAGSDKRGTIYGIYELSEQIGVSPWYWWADVPVKKSAELFIRPGRTVVDSPVVQYRGIFLNDEAPALTGWVYEKYGRFGREFYGRLFELMLRLRANYVWPAMWLPRAFNDDDPETPRLADEYGIVMGTSHHEPMMRAHDEWNRYGRGLWDYAKNPEVLREFWRGGFERSKVYETITTLGMRGDGDEAMSEEANVELLERIVADQRKIIADVSGRPPERVPQLWALYKEVQGYYERGMRVPDDVILLWCDDNWGNIRRLPTPEERKRPGGAGVYYHFDYVGGPRNYKWINVTPITKVWEQMHLAWQHEANRIWIVNVGDLKPMEFPVEFFIRYAWNPARWPYERLDDYSRQWAAREFGAAHAAEIAALVNGYTKLNRHRTPELLSPATYSLVDYREADRVLGQWRDLVARAEAIDAILPADARAAFFQLVLYPVKASATVREVHIAAARNALYAEQGRAIAANAAADHARAMFAQDAALTDRYHALLDGKWNHMMSEKKFGYTYWQTPPAEVLPALSMVRPMRGPEVGLAVEGSRFAYPRWGLPPPRTPAIDIYSRSTTWVDLFSRGDAPLGFKVSPKDHWLRVTPASGTLTDEIRLNIEADWDQVPLGTTTASFFIEVSARPDLSPLDPSTTRFSATTKFGQHYTVTVPIVNPAGLRPGQFNGHIETNGCVSIEAPHFSRAIADGEASWKTLPDHGRTLGGVTAFPVTAAERQPGGGSPRLEYDVWLFSAGEFPVEWHCAPSLDFQPGKGLRFAVSLDDGPPQIVKLETWATLRTWEKSVSDSVRVVTTKHTVAQPGRHVLKFWMVTPGVVLQKVVLDAGGMKPSYLGPPESFHGAAPARPAADQPVMRSDRNSQLAHGQLLEKAKAGGISLYFLGDSITRRWGATDYPDFLAHFKKNFHGWNAGDFGWGGDSTQHMLWRLQNGELDGVNPKVIVLLAGTNNVGKEPGDDAKIADVTRGITALVNLCREKAPGATIILMGILPRNDGPVVPTIGRINANLAKLADGRTVRYLNINDRLADARGRLFDGMTVDQLHLSLKGYQVWADALKPILTELLGPPAAIDTAPPPTGDPSAQPRQP